MKLLKTLLIGIMMLGAVFFCKSITHALFSGWFHENSFPIQAYVGGNAAECCGLVAEGDEQSHFIEAVIPSIFEALSAPTLFVISALIIFFAFVTVAYVSSIRQRFGSFKLFDSITQYLRQGLVHPKIF